MVDRLKIGIIRRCRDDLKNIQFMIIRKFDSAVILRDSLVEVEDEREE